MYQSVRDYVQGTWNVVWNVSKSVGRVSPTLPMQERQMLVDILIKKGVIDAEREGTYVDVFRNPYMVMWVFHDFKMAVPDWFWLEYSKLLMF